MAGLAPNSLQLFSLSVELYVALKLIPGIDSHCNHVAETIACMTLCYYLLKFLTS